MKKRNIKYYVIDLLMAAMLITSVFGMAHITLDEARADRENTTSGNFIFKEFTNIPSAEGTCGQSAAEILRSLNGKKVGVKVSVSSNAQEIIEWVNAADVVWGESIVGYDANNPVAGIYSCTGTVNETISNPQDNTQTVSIPSDKRSISARITITDPDYDKIIDNYQKISVEESSKSIIKTSDLDEKAKTILKNIIKKGKDTTIAGKLKNALLHNQEIKLVLSASKIDEDDLGSKEVDRIEDEAKDDHDDAKVGYYFDMKVTLYIEGTKAGDILETDPDISIEVKIPSSIKKNSSSSSSKSSTRYFKMIRYHGDKAKSLTDYEKDDPIEFDSGKFSTYAIAYYDDSSSSNSSSRSSSISNSTPGSQTPSTGGGAPKTGDNFNPRIWIYLLIVCATVASAAWILLQDTKDDKEKEDNN